jgi:5,6-dimethylbenzimidazole synthase
MHEFPAIEKQGLYSAIYKRRDIRAQFLPDPIPEEVLCRILDAAHHAPSVGYMQPWNFLLIKDLETRRRVKQSFEDEKKRAAQRFEEPKRSKYLSFKLEGILESPINICITCDSSRFGPEVIGRSSILETDVYSVCCCIQNLWLAARAEGVGMGWVSILQNEELRSILDIPKDILPVAYLCLGYVRNFPEEPELEKAKWIGRIPLEETIYFEKWKEQKDSRWDAMSKRLRNHKNGNPAR